MGFYEKLGLVESVKHTGCSGSKLFFENIDKFLTIEKKLPFKHILAFPTLGQICATAVSFRKFLIGTPCKKLSFSVFCQSSPKVFTVPNVLVGMGLTLPSSGQHGLSSGLHSTIHGLRLGFICRGLLGYLHGLFGFFYDY